MGKPINAAIPLLGRFEYEHDYGSPTELDLEYYAVFGDLVPLPNSPQGGVNRYDNFHSWGAWPLAESDGW